MFAPFEQTIEKLKGLFESQRKQDEALELFKTLETDLRKLHDQNQDLEFKYNKLRKLMYGPRSEKVTDEDERQGFLFDEIEDTAETETETESESESESETPAEKKTGGKKKRRRKKRTDWLDKVDFKDNIVYDISEAEKKCPCGSIRSRIGEEISHKLDIIPPKLIGERHIRPKYACKICVGTENENEGAVKIAPLTGQFLPKTMATPGLVAYIATAKFVEHMPLYRLENQFSRLGVDLSRATMSNWMIGFHECSDRLIELHLEDLRQNWMIGIDETTLQVMKETGRKNTTKSYMWVFRGYSSDGRPILRFEYRCTRSGDFLDEILPNFQGCIQSDGYKGYDKFRTRESVISAGCWSHGRRKFKEVLDQFPKSAVAGDVMRLIRSLYAVEDLAKEKKFSFAEIRDLRQKKSKPVIQELKQILDDAALRLPPAGPAGKAIKYALNQWPKLIVYLDDGRIPIDNNLVENAIRPFALGRKNWLFSGGPRGAHASAWLYTLVESAKANELDPYWYLRYLFANLTQAKSDDDLRALLPHRIDRSLVKALVRPTRY